MTLSVVIPAHNAEPFLAATLDSIGRQTTRASEVIVVDDGSDDLTARIAEGHRFPDGTSPRVIRSHRRQGVAAARNRGAHAATGEWIGLCDADDLWHPERIGQVLAAGAAQPDALAIATGSTGFALTSDRPALAGHPRAGMVSHWVETDDVATLVELVPATPASTTPREVTLSDLQQDIMFATTTVCYRREAWALAGGCAVWNHLADDYVLNVSIATLGRILALPEPHVFYRVRPASLSHDAGELTVPFLIANLAARYGGSTRDDRPAGHLYRHLLRELSTRPTSLALSDVLGLALLGHTGPRQIASIVRHRRRTHSAPGRARDGRP